MLTLTDSELYRATCYSSTSLTSIPQMILRKIVNQLTPNVSLCTNVAIRLRL